MQTKKNKTIQQSHIPKFDDGGFAKGLFGMPNVFKPLGKDYTAEQNQQQWDKIASITGAVGTAGGLGLNLLSDKLERRGIGGQKRETFGSGFAHSAGATLPLAAQLAPMTGGLSFLLPAIAGIVGGINSKKEGDKQDRIAKADGIVNSMQSVQYPDELGYAKYGGYVKKYGDGGGIKEDMVRYTSVGQHSLSNPNLKALDLNPNSLLLPEVVITADKIVKKEYAGALVNSIGNSVISHILSEKPKGDKQGIKNKLQAKDYADLMTFLKHAERSNLTQADIRNAESLNRLQMAYGGTASNPVQTEKGEYIVNPSRTMVYPTNAKTTHNQMPTNMPTDNLEEGSYVLSNKLKSGKDYELLAALMPDIDLSVINKFRGKSDQISPASLAANVDKRYQYKEPKSYQFATPKLNARGMKDATEALIKLNEQTSDPRKVLAAYNNSPTYKSPFAGIPHAALGGMFGDPPLDNYAWGYDPNNIMISDYEEPASFLPSLPATSVRNGNYHVPGRINGIIGDDAIYYNPDGSIKSQYIRQNSKGEGVIQDPGARIPEHPGLQPSGEPKKKPFDPTNAMFAFNLLANLMNKKNKMYDKAHYDTTNLNNMKWELPMQPQLYALQAAQNTALDSLRGTSNWKNFAANASNIATNTQVGINNAFAANNTASMQQYNTKRMALAQVDAERFRNDQAYLTDKANVINYNQQILPKTLQQFSTDSMTRLGEMSALKNEKNLMEGLIKVMGGNGMKELLEQLAGIGSGQIALSGTTAPSSFVGPVVPGGK